MFTPTIATGSSNATLGRRKGAWTREEDLLLKKCVERYGEGNWQKVPLRAGLSRCRKSCRLRWLNYLKPGIKRDEFDVHEIDLILRLHRLLGNRWALIAGRIPGRTANDIKNYWNSHLSKRVDPKTSMITDHRGMKLGNNRKRRSAGTLKMAVDKQKKMKRTTKRIGKMVEENGAASIVLQANNGDETTVVKPRPLTIRPSFHTPKVTTSPRREHSKPSSCLQMVLKSGSITLDPNPTHNANSETSPSNAKEGNTSLANSSNEDSWLLSSLFGPEDESTHGGDVSFSMSPPRIVDDDNRQLELKDLDLDDDILWKVMSNWSTQH